MDVNKLLKLQEGDTFTAQLDGKSRKLTLLSKVDNFVFIVSYAVGNEKCVTVITSDKI